MDHVIPIPNAPPPYANPLPPPLDPVQDRADVTGQIASLSMDHLRKLRAHWYCASAHCDTSSEEKGGFRIARPENEKIYLLPCGHYFCHPCRKSTCKHGCLNDEGKETFSYETEEERARLVPANHLMDVMKKLRRCGMACTKCGNEGYRREVEEEHRNRRRSGSPRRIDAVVPFLIDTVAPCFAPHAPPAKYRHPHNAIAYCSSCHHKNSPSEVQKSPTELVENLLCWHCAASSDDHGKKHAHAIKSIHESPMHEELLKEVQNRDSVMTDKDRQDFAHAPWNMVLLSYEEMFTLCKVFLTCSDCSSAYVTSDASHPLYRPPRFLPCGHVVCLQCMENRKAGSNTLRCHDDACIIAPGLEPVDRLPPDFKMIIGLPLSDFGQCDYCRTYHPHHQRHAVDDQQYCSKCHLFPNLPRPT